MKLFPQHIRIVGDGRYLVQIKTLDPETEQEFEFRVTRDAIRVVSCSDEFIKFLEYNMGPAKHLYQAIAEFDLAQGTEILLPSSAK